MASLRRSIGVSPTRLHKARRFIEIGGDKFDAAQTADEALRHFRSFPVIGRFKFGTIARGAKVLRVRRSGRSASSRGRKLGVARRNGGGEGALQPRRIGRDAGELCKRLDRLMHAHAAAVERAGALRLRL